MGTSKSYSGPKWPGVNSALSNAVSGGPPDDEAIINSIGKFANGHKSFLRSGSGTSRPGHVEQTRSGGRGRRYSVGGRGGGAGNVSRARAAASGAALAHFISSASSSGLSNALQRLNLNDFIDKPLYDLLEALADTLSGDGGLLDDDSINRAIAETLNELAIGMETFDQFDDLLTSGTVDIESVLQLYYAHLLAANFEQKEYDFVRNKISREDTDHFFKQAHEIILAIVRDELTKERDLSSINWNGTEGQKLADSINLEVLDILMP